MRAAPARLAGYAPTEERVEEPAVALAVELPAGRHVLGVVARRIRHLEVDRHPHARAGRLAAQDVGREPVREQHVMRRGDRVGGRRPPGCMHAVAVAEPGDHPGLVLGQPERRRDPRAGGPRSRRTRRTRRRCSARASRPRPRARRGDPSGRASRGARCRSRAARRSRGRRSRGPPGSPGRGPPGGRAATRRRGGTRSPRARASGRCPRGSGGRSRRRPRRSRRSGPCRAWRRSDPRCSRRARRARSPLRSGRPRCPSPRGTPGGRRRTRWSCSLDILTV